jgi:SPP1 family predicted phage head-tail adaptor
MQKKRAKADPLAIDAGRLRHPIQIQSLLQTQSATGALTDSWQTVHQTMAAIDTMSSREVWSASQFTEEVTHVVTIRWPGSTISIQGGQQILFGPRTFKLQTVENVQERNRVLILHCLEINGAR